MECWVKIKPKNVEFKADPYYWDPYYEISGGTLRDGVLRWFAECYKQR